MKKRKLKRTKGHAVKLAFEVAPELLRRLDDVATSLTMDRSKFCRAALESKVTEFEHERLMATEQLKDAWEKLPYQMRVYLRWIAGHRGLPLPEKIKPKSL